MTVEQLQALSDEELNALAAKLRGWKLLESDHDSWRGVTGNYYFESEDGEAECSEGDWTPATSRDQSGELLEWAWRNRGILFHVGFTGGGSPGYVQFETPITHHMVRGNDARSETIAFCAAMLAILPN